MIYTINYMSISLSALVDSDVCRNVMTLKDKWHVDTQFPLSTRPLSIHSDCICLMTRHVVTFRVKWHVDTQIPLWTRALISLLYFIFPICMMWIGRTWWNRPIIWVINFVVNMTQSLTHYGCCNGFALGVSLFMKCAWYLSEIKVVRQKFSI